MTFTGGSPRRSAGKSRVLSRCASRSAGAKRLRWRSELEEAITAGDGGAHSALELRWDRDVERAHGLPGARKQVRFRKQNGGSGYRDRVYPEYGVIIELDG